MAAGTFGIDTDANLLYSLLLADSPITINPLDLSSNLYEVPSDTTSGAYQVISKLQNADYTTGATDGTGTFDVFMQGMKAQLQCEFQSGRITGAEYTKAYVALLQAAMQNAVQYLLGRDQAYWQSVNAQTQAITARVQLEEVKYQAVAAQIEAKTAMANLALTKAKLATEDAQYGQISYQISNMLPAQLALLNQQLQLVTEQTQVQRAQTLDTRTDGSTVAGSVGMQKQLYSQQITSYKRDAEQKVAKIYSDAWVTQKTMDDGLTAPNAFTNATVDAVMSALQNNIGLS